MKKAKKKAKVQTQNKLFQTGLAALILILIVLLAKQLPPKSEKNSSATYPDSNSKDHPQIEISGVKVNDFFKTAPDTTSYGYTIVSWDSKYQILFFPDSELFLISILGNPFDDYVGLAEQDFLDKLGINEEEACKLNVSITTPGYRNPDKAGEVYELSWCE